MTSQLTSAPGPSYPFLSIFPKEWKPEIKFADKTNPFGNEDIAVIAFGSAPLCRLTKLSGLFLLAILTSTSCVTLAHQT